MDNGYDLKTASTRVRRAAEWIAARTQSHVVGWLPAADGGIVVVLGNGLREHLNPDEIHELAG